MMVGVDSHFGREWKWTTKWGGCGLPLWEWTPRAVTRGNVAIWEWTPRLGGEKWK
jgi:hypothetical protein